MGNCQRTHYQDKRFGNTNSFEQHMRTNFWRTLAVFAAFIICLMPAAAYAMDAGDIQDVVKAARTAGLHQVFVPAAKSDEQNRFEIHGASGLVVFESKNYQIMESPQKILLDTPNEQEPFQESINGSQEAVWDTYLLPGGTVQHALMLAYDGMWVSIVPKWTSHLSEGGFAATEKTSLSSESDFKKVVAMARTLQRMQIH
jgi:hypothetical protein